MKNDGVKSIFFDVDYGTIRIKLDDIMNKREISTYEISSKANVRFQTIQNLRKNTSSRIDFEVLSKICYALNCNVEDIIEYVPKN
jgi:putative transcriptional regulator